MAKRRRGGHGAAAIVRHCRVHLLLVRTVPTAELRMAAASFSEMLASARGIQTSQRGIRDYSLRNYLRPLQYIYIYIYKLKQETGSGKKRKSDDDDDDDDDDGETLESETRHKNFDYLIFLI